MLKKVLKAFAAAYVAAAPRVIAAGGLGIVVLRTDPEKEVA
jgi:hypothetical protein